MTVKAIALFSHVTGQTTAYYSLPDGQTSPAVYGDIGEGEVVTLTGVTKPTDGSMPWVQFQRANGATLYAPLRRSDVATANLTTAVAVPLINSGLEQSGDVAVWATLYGGVEVFSEPDGNANVLASLPAGSVLHVTRVDGVGAPRDGFVEIAYVGTDGIAIKAYVDTLNAGDVKTYVTGKEYTQWLILLPCDWEDVPVVGADEPTPPDTTPDDNSGDTVEPPSTISTSAEDVIEAAANLVRALYNYHRAQ